MAGERSLNGKLTKSALIEIERALDGLSHGSVQLIVQDSRIIQIDVIEKIRLDKGGIKRGPATDKIRINK